MQVDPHRQLLAARDDRARTDYVFDFWTAFGWTLLSCGIYGLYVDYKIVQRMRDHNARRLAFLSAANDLAWQRAIAAGRDDELRGRFERVAADLSVLHRMTADFRDPTLWLIIFIFGQGIGQIVAHVLIDMDLVKHGAAEADAEWQLGELFHVLGAPLVGPPSPLPAKQQHQYALRVLAFFVSCSVYTFWWWADLMREGNQHFAHDWAWEDSLVRAVAASA